MLEVSSSEGVKAEIRLGPRTHKALLGLRAARSSSTPPEVGAHGGGAFSSKDPTKVDRSAAYICRQMEKSVVKSGLCKRALVQLSNAIGVAKLLSLFVATYGGRSGRPFGRCYHQRD